MDVSEFCDHVDNLHLLLELNYKLTLLTPLLPLPCPRLLYITSYFSDICMDTGKSAAASGGKKISAARLVNAGPSPLATSRIKSCDTD